jgi:hypothetical protein
MVRYFPVARGAADADLPALALQHMGRVRLAVKIPDEGF